MTRHHTPVAWSCQTPTCSWRPGRASSFPAVGWARRRRAISSICWWSAYLIGVFPAALAFATAALSASVRQALRSFPVPTMTATSVPRPRTRACATFPQSRVLLSGRPWRRSQS